MRAIHLTRFRKLALLAVAMGMMCNTSPAATVVVTSTADALVNSTNNINYNTGQFFDIIGSETGLASGYWGGWIKFDLTPLLGQMAVSATLELTAVFNHSSTPINHSVFSSSGDAWVEGTISGANMPLESTLTFLDVKTVPNINGVYTWNVLAAVNGTDGRDNATLSLLIRPETFPDGAVRGPHFNSKEAGNSPPTLRITTVPEPSSALLLLLGGAICARRRLR